MPMEIYQEVRLQRIYEIFFVMVLFPCPGSLRYCLAISASLSSSI
jgi:hypothetical protein